MDLFKSVVRLSDNSFTMGGYVHDEFSKVSLNHMKLVVIVGTKESMM